MSLQVPLLAWGWASVQTRRLTCPPWCPVIKRAFPVEHWRKRCCAMVAVVAAAAAAAVAVAAAAAAAAAVITSSH